MDGSVVPTSMAPDDRKLQTLNHLSLQYMAWIYGSINLLTVYSARTHAVCSGINNSSCVNIVDAVEKVHRWSRKEGFPTNQKIQH
jgi:hypothetical protein